jgi:hypothetical protein
MFELTAKSGDIGACLVEGQNNYLGAPKDLILTEEYLIAKSHPMGVIVRLRPQQTIMQSVVIL